MHKDKGKYHYLVENFEGVFKSIKATFDGRGNIVREELACFLSEKEAEFLIRDLVDQQNKEIAKAKEDLRKSSKKKKELFDIVD